MSGGQDQAAEQISDGWRTAGWPTDLEQVVAAYLSPLRHQIASLQVDQACMRARIDSIEGRAQKRPELPKPRALDFGPPVQFQCDGCWKSGHLVVLKADRNKSPALSRIDEEVVCVSCLDGLWLVAAGDLTEKPLRTD